MAETQDPTTPQGKAALARYLRAEAARGQAEREWQEAIKRGAGHRVQAGLQERTAREKDRAYVALKELEGTS